VWFSWGEGERERGRERERERERERGPKRGRERERGRQERKRQSIHAEVWRSIDVHAELAVMRRVLYIQLASAGFLGQEDESGEEEVQQQDAGEWSRCGSFYLAALQLFVSCHVIVWVSARPRVSMDVLHFLRALMVRK
jgi:hypothetical protein